MHWQQWVMMLIESECEEMNVTSIHLIDVEDWRQPIIDHLEHEKFLKESCRKIEV